MSKDKFDIAEGLNVEMDSDVIDDQLREATHRIAEQKERLLAMALLRGYDGVDITLSDPTPTRQSDYKHSFEWEAWEGDPEPLEPYASNTQRYDFRVLRDHEKRQLLAHIGVMDLGEIQE
jgi:hypothetical protein